MPVESIIAIVVAATSAVSSIATFAYMKFRKSFGDQQDTAIEITNTISRKYDEHGNCIGNDNTAKIVINMKNFEQYLMEASKLEESNQQKVVTTSKSKEVIGNNTVTAKTATTSPKIATSEDTPLMPVNIKNNSSSSKVINYANNSNYTSLEVKEELTSVLNNNAHGDDVISETRIVVISEALKTFKEIIQAVHHTTDPAGLQAKNNVEINLNVTGEGGQIETQIN